MRLAHLVGLSPDGDSLVIATEDGEELSVVLDGPLRQAVRVSTAQGGTAGGGRTRPGRGENEMETSFSPRDVQMRIRAGETLEEVAEVAGIPYERVERFAAPVLAEREHLALMALSASVRRRGETAGHRNLRGTVAERLLKRGVDVDDIAWDSHRLEDGRWAVTADYRLDEADHHATFWFDARGRFSVAGDDEARRLIGEPPPVESGGSRPGDTAEEPTVDLSDELALVRATLEAAAGAAHSAEEPEHDGVLPGALVTEAVVTEVVVERMKLSVVEQTVEADDPGAEPPAEPPASAELAEPAVAGVEDRSELTTLYAMLGSAPSSDEAPRGYAGLSDASAVPETAGGGWEPAIVVDYPVEPSPVEEAELPLGEHPDHSQVPMDDKAPVELSTPVDDGSAPGALPAPEALPAPKALPAPQALPGTAEPAPPYARTNEADHAEEAAEFQLESEPAPDKKPKRKRASVPSWDEIMFGGPKPPA